MFWKMTSAYDIEDFTHCLLLSKSSDWVDLVPLI
jgi:hypothetical protein